MNADRAFRVMLGKRDQGDLVYLFYQKHKNGLREVVVQK